MNPKGEVTMKLKDMTPRQRKVVLALREAASEIAAFENTMLDNRPGTPEYEAAAELFSNPQEIRSRLYDMVVNEFGEREIRFLGKAWIEDRIDAKMRQYDWEV